MHKMAGTKFSTATYTNEPPKGLRYSPVFYSPSVYPPCPRAFPPNTSCQLPQVRRNVQTEIPRENPGRIQYPLGGYPCSPANGCVPRMSHCPGVSQPSAKCSIQTYPYSSGNRMSSIKTGHGLPNHPRSQGESGWTPSSQSYIPQSLRKRGGEEVAAPGNPPSKRLRQDQSGQPYSVQVNGHRKGMHIQGSCYLTVRQDKTQQQPMTEGGYSSGDKSPTLSWKNKSNCSDMLQTVQGHVDGSVNPVLQKTQPQIQASAVFRENLDSHTVARDVTLELIERTCKHVPRLNDLLKRLRTEHNILCLSRELCSHLLKWFTIPKDRALLNFYMHYKAFICKSVNQGRCSECANDSTDFRRNENNQQNGSCNGSKLQKGDMIQHRSHSAIGNLTSRRIPEGDKRQPLTVLQSVAMNAGKNVMSQSTQNRGKVQKLPYPAPTSLSHNISNTVLSESELRDRPHNVVNNISDKCDGNSANHQVTSPPNRPYLAQGSTSCHGAKSVQSKQTVSPNIIGNPFHQSGSDAFAASSPGLSPTQQWMIQNVSTYQPPIATNTTAVKQIHNTQGINRLAMPNATRRSASSSSPNLPSTSNSITYSHCGQGMKRSPVNSCTLNNQSITNSGHLSTAAASPMIPVVSKKCVSIPNQPYNIHMVDKLRRRTNLQLANPASNNVVRKISPQNTSQPRRGATQYPVSHPTDERHYQNLHVAANASKSVFPAGQSPPTAVSANGSAPQTQRPTSEDTVFPELNRTYPVIQASCKNFRQQAATLMKLPQSIRVEKPPMDSLLTSPNSPRPKADKLNCFTLEPSTKTRRSPLSADLSHLSCGSSKGWFLPPRVNNECIYIEDSDDEEPRNANSDEAPVDVSVPIGSTDTTDINQTRKELVKTGDSFRTNPFHSSCENNQLSTHSDVRGNLPKTNTMQSSNNPDGNVMLEETISASQVKNGKPLTKISPDHSTGVGNAILCEASKEPEGNESLRSLIACGDATFATFVFDEGSGDMEITTAEFGEQEWEQLMRG